MRRLLFALAVVTTAALGGVLLTSGRGSIVYAALAFAAALYLVLEPAKAQRPRRLPEPAASPSPEAAQLDAVLGGISDAVIALDEAQRITLANDAARALLNGGASPIGRSLLEVVRAPGLAELAAGASKGAAGAAHTRELSLGPAERRFLARAAAVERGVVIVLHDVTEIRRLESVRRDFVANVSHELRTPVSIIRANAETLLDGALEDQSRAREFVDAVLRHSERLGRLIDDLLDLSRIEAGRYPIKLGRVDARVALARAVELVREPARAKALRVSVADGEKLEVAADPRALEQILANLLDNAVKYTPSGGAIELRARRRGDRVALEVADDGPGIEPRHRERLFERFYRVDPGRSREVGGTGLGLAIVKHLAEAMGGTVGVEAAQPHGSVFWVALPEEQGQEPEK